MEIWTGTSPDCTAGHCGVFEQHADPKLPEPCVWLHHEKYHTMEKQHRPPYSRRTFITVMLLVGYA